MLVTKLILLQRFFGMIRSFGGDEDHPTIISFSHIYRLLSLYTPIKACIHGSVTGESTYVLATMEEAPGCQSSRAGCPGPPTLVVACRSELSVRVRVQACGSCFPFQRCIG
uniref:Putative secreted protein n=1 Tax=Ixodes ricinus TaxID=34613 RepID=A0A6B0UJB5_IXORI